MKTVRYCALVLALFFFALPAMAQFSVGVVAGINSAGVSWDLDGEEEDTNSKSAFSFGLLADYLLSENMSISAQPRIIGKGGEQDETDDFFGLEFKLSYIEIPILVRYLFGTGDIRPFVEAGPAIGFLSSAEIEYTDGDVDDIKDDLKSTDFSLIVGGGVDVPVGDNTFFGALRLATGLSNIDDRGGSGDELLTRGLELVLGFKLPVGN